MEEGKRKIELYLPQICLGVDVSALFQSVFLLSQNGDLSLKKMSYCYVTNLAKTHPELCILSLGTLVKDYHDVDAKVRGWALRTICSLQVDGFSKDTYVYLIRALKDPDPYVRKIGIHGILKQRLIEPDFYQSVGIILLFPEV